MSDPLQRRSFLSRFALGITTALAAPLVAASRKLGGESEATTPKQAIRKVKPLGFQWETADPFLFCVHHEDRFPKGNQDMGPACSLQGRHLGDDFIIKDGFRMYHGKKVPGFPGHPHRGFETITVVRKGLVDHADSMGAAGRYGNGDVQWMTAGQGVQHSEMFPLLSQEKENPLELFQIWLNLPARNKMVEPHFKMLWRDEIPHFTHRNASGKSTVVEVIAGQLGDRRAPAPPPDSWAAPASNEVAIWNIKMDAGGSWTLPKASKGVNRTLYCYEGEGIRVDGTVIPRYNAVELEPDMAVEIMAGTDRSSILLLQGRPIGETVIQYGPFVMNTKEEINQAFEDYHRTQFGGWPWPRYDQVHDRTRKRFARHADGREEIKQG